MNKGPQGALEGGEGVPGRLPHHEASRCWVLGQLLVSVLLLASHWGDTHLSWGPDGGSQAGGQ